MKESAHARLERLVRHLGFAGAAAVLLVSGCSTADGSQPTPPPTSQIRVGYFRSVDVSPFFLAVQNELFAKAGLTVTSVPFDNDAQVLSALENGQVDIAYGTYPLYFAAEASGKIKLRLVTEGYEATQRSVELMVTANSPIASPTQLSGQKVAVDDDAGFGVVALKAALTDSGLASDGTQLGITFVPTPPEQMAQALTSGQVAAAVMTEPYITEGQQNQQLQALTDLSSESVGGLPVGGYFTTDSFAGANGAAVTRFVNVITQADNLTPNTKLIGDALTTQLSLSPPAAMTLTIGSFPTGIRTDRLTDFATMMERLKMLPPTFQLSSLTG